MIGFKNNSAAGGNGNDDTSNLILEQGIVSNIANIYKYSGGYKWQINNEIYQTTTDKTRTIVAAAVGFYRIDIAVLDTNNDIVLIQGVENASAAKMPNVPNDTILLNSWVIFGNTINPPSSTVKSINQDNIPLRYDILSTALATNDVAGFVTYLNNLNAYKVQVKEINSLVQFRCTDTGDVYQLSKVGKGTYGLGEIQITADNVLKYSDVAKSNSYSTTETKTGGTWIDGKPIYRKVIPFTLPNGSIAYDLSGLGMDVFLGSEAILFDDNDEWINEQIKFYPDNFHNFYSRNTFPNLLEIAFIDTIISTGATTHNQIGRSGYCTIEYTKTTD